ncbi:hypothetical protein CGLO_07170 [Colletotrichum gloeosporioides Cg-14]|uniref:Uncharacterized protein n=1 Tax=Colletotrichum gloeosporioides (strain Cg-14) TaxID=1237896 RepID=T0LXK1_COLGC|nr:hypothetical protein CGLO_07170 [Colletotrichum gloeosporioides Cg-14]
MPWLSRSPSYNSPASSPRLSNSARSSPRTSPRSSLCGPIKNYGPSVTYIPPLIDGACGTVPLAQKQLFALLQDDLREMWKMLPGLMTSLRTHVANHRAHLSRSHLKDIIVQLSLAIVEVGMITLAVPMFMILPGILFAAWLALSMSLVLALSWLMNGSNIIVNCDEFGNSTPEAEEDEEKWIFIGGMGTSSTHLSQCTLPRLARLFGKSFSGIQMATYGLPFDMLLLAIQRCFPFQTQASRALYSELRTALLDAAVTRVAVLAHNNGTLPTALVLARLCADIQPEKLNKLEIYTFGAAASEFVVPLGDSRKSRFEEAVIDERGPHIEHFAYANDPFAQMGVLRAVNKKFDGRFCGGVYIIHNQIPQPSGHWVPDQRPVMLLTDYLSALFPDPSSPSAPSSLLDYVMVIDRDIAERRELAAMANHAQTKRTRKDNRRLSWTALGATVGGKNGLLDGGVMGLELARKGCRDCDGHRGREVSWLHRYVQTGWVVEKKDSNPVADAMGILCGHQ